MDKEILKIAEKYGADVAEELIRTTTKPQQEQKEIGEKVASIINSGTKGLMAGYKDIAERMGEDVAKRIMNNLK